MRMWNSLQTKFFLTYSIIFIAIILLVSIPVYVYLKNNIERDTISRINENISIIKDKVDGRIDQFNIISRLFYTTASGTSQITNYLNDLIATDNIYENYALRKSLQSFVSMLYVIYPDADSIRVVTVNGDVISNLLTDATQIKPLNYYESMSPLLQSNGEILLKYEPKDPWLAANHKPVFSISRLLMPWESRSGILSVQLKADELVPLDAIKQIKGANFTLFFKNKLVFSTLQANTPLMADVTSAYDAFKAQGKIEKSTSLKEMATGKEYVFYQSTGKADVEVILTVPEKTFFTQLNFFRNVAMATILLLILFSVSVFYILSRILTNPLKNLKKSIDLIDLADKQLDIDNKYHMDEINLINRAFRSMNNRLQNSLEETVRFRTLQLQSNFDMLQAQINPHFLFNMLGFIQSSAEDKDFIQVSALSRNLLGFFRYSISTKSPVITLEKEVEFTQQFLELMQTRFMHRLSYSLEIDSDLLNILVPKLTLQPLVENCIHHGLHDRMHTLKIKVKAFINGDNWEIEINDNGMGFSAEGLSALNKKVDAYISRMHESMDGERLSLGGMGIASTISRLKFLFKEQFYYFIGNNEDDGGARIRLRGPLNSVTIED